MPLLLLTLPLLLMPLLLLTLLLLLLHLLHSKFSQLSKKPAFGPAFLFLSRIQLSNVRLSKIQLTHNSAAPSHLSNCQQPCRNQSSIAYAHKQIQITYLIDYE
jgi:hypothetical protein